MAPYERETKSKMACHIKGKQNPKGRTVLKEIENGMGNKKESVSSKKRRKSSVRTTAKTTDESRHYNMQRIKSKDTSIELKLRRALWNKGYRYRKNLRTLPGAPDIVLTKYKIAIFCDSEFFHGKDWEVLKPQLERGNNAQFWIDKITNTRRRDDEANKRLLYLGWTVIRFWGKDILKDVDTCVKVVEETIFDNELGVDSEEENIFDDELGGDSEEEIIFDLKMDENIEESENEDGQE